VDLIGDVGDEPKIRPLDYDVIVGGKLVRDGVQTRGRLFQESDIFSFSSMRST
jgi:hypothetical protein